MTQKPMVVVVGARRARQGIGAFVSSWFAQHGAEVCAIVGTSANTIAEARAHLRGSFGIKCRGYTTLDDALQHEAADIVVLCTPYHAHAAHLAVVAQAGLHCLCEKPLYWREPPSGASDDAADGNRHAVERLIDDFARRGLLLETVTQWRMTLPAFFELHPDERDLPVRRFEMGLSPISTGAAMIPDAAPHLVSMLRDLCGDGEVVEPRVELLPKNPAGSAAARLRRITLSCRYEHGGGVTESVLHLRTCARRPRPAWYAINGCRVDRQIELPAYEQFFTCDDRRVRIKDPLGLLVAHFVDGVQKGRETDAAALLRDQANVESLYQAALEFRDDQTVTGTAVAKA